MKTEAFSLATANDVVTFTGLVRVIRYDEGAGTGTPKIRIRSLNTGVLDAEMIPGRQIRLPEVVGGIIITNLTGAAITGKITIGAGDVTDNSLVGTVTLDAATLAALESTDVNAASIAQLLGIRPDNAIANNSGGAASAVLTAVASGTNVNGLWVTEAQIFGYNSAAAHAIALIAKATAPANTADGQVILHAGALSGQNFFAQLNKPVFVPAGLGLHFFNVSADSGHAGLMRAARWDLL